VGSNTGTWRYDRELGLCVKISDEIPRIASRVNILGEHVYCEPNGETLDFGKGPVHVNNASEKRKVLRSFGVAPAPDGVSHISQPKFDPDTVPSFKEHFQKEHGTPLSEAQGLVHVKEN
jgi:hypothetical protein